MVVVWVMLFLSCCSKRSSGKLVGWLNTVLIILGQEIVSWSIMHLQIWCQIQKSFWELPLDAWAFQYLSSFSMFICWSPNWILVMVFEIIKLQRICIAVEHIQGCWLQLWPAKWLLRKPCGLSDDPERYYELRELILACWLLSRMLDSV